MSGENLRETTNPSAVLMSRIRKGRYQDEGKGGGNFIKKMKPTDMRRALQRRAMMNTTPRKTQHAMMVQEFLTGVFDDQARLLFLCLSPQMRTALMEQDSLENAQKKPMRLMILKELNHVSIPLRNIVFLLDSVI